MIGVWVLGSLAAMWLLRKLADVIMRHDDRREDRRRVDSDALSLVSEAQEWLDQRHPGTV